MPNFQNSRTRAKVVSFIDYKPAELRIQQVWLIVYYAKNPLTDKLERIRLRVPVLANKKERERHANRIVVGINNKLAEGWSPFLESSAKNFKSFRECHEKFMEQVEKEIRDGIKREDTRRSYNSYISMINTYLKEKKIKLTFAIEFNKVFVINYLDWIYYDRQNSPTTYNNHLTFIHNIGEFMIARGYIAENPTVGITKKRELKKKRLVLSTRAKKLLRSKLPQYSYAYFCLCMTTYYSLIRRTELTKLKVRDIDLLADSINIPVETGKTNTIEQSATIPAGLKTLLQYHLEGANDNDYVFSANEFKPGAIQLKPKKISDTFSKIRKELGLPDGFQFYSFKDTGIVDLFDLGVSSLKIRDQARHSDLKTTERYTQRSNKGDTAIKDSGLGF